MFVHYRTEGIVLKKENRGESNQLLTFYTKDFGKLDIVGKAIRKISSKLRSGTEVFYLTEIEFIQGKKQKTLTDAIPIERSDSLRKNLAKLKLAHKITEVLDDLIISSEKDNKIWSLLLSVLKVINSSDFKISELRLQYYYFLWHLLLLLGYLPELYNCTLCRRRLNPGKLYFCPEDGGIVCHPCHQKSKEKKEISVPAIKILRTIIKNSISIVKRLKVDAGDLKELQLISDYFLRHVIKRNKSF